MSARRADRAEVHWIAWLTGGHPNRAHALREANEASSGPSFRPDHPCRFAGAPG